MRGSILHYTSHSATKKGGLQKFSPTQHEGWLLEENKLCVLISSLSCAKGGVLIISSVITRKRCFVSYIYFISAWQKVKDSQRILELEYAIFPIWFNSLSSMILRDEKLTPPPKKKTPLKSFLASYFTVKLPLWLGIAKHFLCIFLE